MEGRWKQSKENSFTLQSKIFFQKIVNVIKLGSVVTPGGIVQTKVLRHHLYASQHLRVEGVIRQRVPLAPVEQTAIRILIRNRSGSHGFH